MKAYENLQYELVARIESESPLAITIEPVGIFGIGSNPACDCEACNGWPSFEGEDMMPVQEG